jgi:hypothetical protein
MSAEENARRALSDGYIIADERYSLDPSTYLGIIDRYEEAIKDLLAERAPAETDAALRDMVAEILDEAHGPQISEGGCDFRARWSTPYRAGQESAVGYDPVVDEVIAAVSVARVREIIQLVQEDDPAVATLIDETLAGRHPLDVQHAVAHPMPRPGGAFRIRNRISQEDVPIHVAADIEQIICETEREFGGA